MKIPKASCYYEPSKQNAIRIDTEGLTVWYSYRTPVAFHVCGHGRMVVRQNEWGSTTRKHLNAIDGGEQKSMRVDAETFRVLWTERTKGL